MTTSVATRLRVRILRTIPTPWKQATKRAARRLARQSSPDGSLRLNLGCGFDYRRGYVNVDLSPSADCDLKMDFTQAPALFPANAVREVLLIHALVYLRLWQARDLFRDVYRILEPGGRFVVETADFEKCARAALDSAGRWEQYVEAVRGIYAFDDRLIAERRLYPPAAFGWSMWHLIDELRAAGFGEVQTSDPETHQRRTWRDSRVVAVKLPAP